MNEMIQRYIYQVGKYLPQQNRKEIQAELNSAIYEMLPESPTEEEVTIALITMGDPRKVAAGYSPHLQYLVGPELYPTYIKIMPIIIAAVSFGLVVAISLQAVINSVALSKFVFEVLGSIFGVALSVFGGVTLAFALIQRFILEDVSKELENEWHPSQLPNTKYEYERISIFGLTFELVMSLLFIMVIVFYPNVIGAYYFTDVGINHVPLFNEESIRIFIPFIIGGYAFLFVHSAILMMKGEWTKKLRVSKMFLAAYNALLWTVFFTNGRVINEEIFISMNMYLNFNPSVIDTGHKTIILLLVGIIIITSLKEIVHHARRL